MKDPKDDLEDGDDPAGDSFGNEDEIEEYIRKHLNDPDPKDDDKMKAKLMLGQEKVEEANGGEVDGSDDEESFPESDAESVDLDSEQITPK